MTIALTTTEAPHASARASGVVLAFAIVDLAWAVLGFLATLLLVFAGLALLVRAATEPSLGRWASETWAELSGVDRGRVATLAVEALLGVVFNALLLIGAVRLLTQRRGAFGFVRAWAIGVFAMSAIDLAWVVSTWVDPWSWIAVPVVLVSPLWAAANVCALRAVEGRATSSGGAPA